MGFYLDCEDDLSFLKTELFSLEEQLKYSKNLYSELDDSLNLSDYTDSNIEHLENKINNLKGQIKTKEKEMGPTLFIRKALKNTNNIILGQDENKNEISCLDDMLSKRIESPDNPNSSYDISCPTELYMALQTQDWVETSNPNIPTDCRIFKCNLPGNNATFTLDSLPYDAEIYVSNPHSTDKISIGVGNVNKKKESETYLITGKKSINNIEEDVVIDFFPGEPVALKQVESSEIFDGTKITTQKAKNLGFEAAQLLSPKILEKYHDNDNLMDLSDQKKFLEEKILEIKNEINQTNEQLSKLQYGKESNDNEQIK